MESDKIKQSFWYNKFCTCDHVMVDCYKEFGGLGEGDFITYRGCIKCGYSNYVSDHGYTYTDVDDKDNYFKAMLKYHFDICNSTIDKFDYKKINDCFCNQLFAQDIYRDIVCNNPNIDDNKLIVEFGKQYRCKTRANKVLYKSIKNVSSR